MNPKPPADGPEGQEVILKRIRTAFFLNTAIFVLEVIAITWMMIGVTQGPLAASGVEMLKYFTVDSNILLGLAALIAARDQWQVLKGRKAAVSPAVSLLKLTATASITLTMMVTVFFLMPTTAAELGPFAMFYGSNFLLHLLNPLAGILCFALWEKTDRISFRQTLFGVLPMALYAVYYVINVLTHLKDGAVLPAYDWYGFFFAGTGSVLFVVPLLMLFTWGFSAALWKWNRRGA